VDEVNLEVVYRKIGCLFFYCTKEREMNPKYRPHDGSYDGSYDGGMNSRDRYFNPSHDGSRDGS
jgi:hypothetical protein